MTIDTLEKMSGLALIEFFEEAMKRNDTRMIMFAKAELISRLNN